MKGWASSSSERTTRIMIFIEHVKKGPKTAKKGSGQTSKKKVLWSRSLKISNLLLRRTNN